MFAESLVSSFVSANIWTNWWHISKLSIALRCVLFSQEIRNKKKMPIHSNY